MGALSALRASAERVMDQPETFGATCRLALVQTRKQGETQPLFYMACQEPKQGNGLPCNRRVNESGFCQACNRAGKIGARLNLRCRFADYSDGMWFTTFHEGAQRVLGLTAEEAKTMESGEGRESLDNALRERYFDEPMQITVRAKLDSFNGEPRTNI